jgi:hypothetical protein
MKQARIKTIQSERIVTPLLNIAQQVTCSGFVYDVHSIDVKPDTFQCLRNAGLLDSNEACNGMED